MSLLHHQMPLSRVILKGGKIIEPQERKEGLMVCAVDKQDPAGNVCIICQDGGNLVFKFHYNGHYYLTVEGNKLKLVKEDTGVNITATSYQFTKVNQTCGIHYSLKSAAKPNMYITKQTNQILTLSENHMECILIRDENQNQDCCDCSCSLRGTP